jgi:ABC-type transport system involved in Fe-S cluster assembly fused permease/ATPase subunit
MVEAILLYVLLQTSRVVIQIKLSNVSFKIKYKNKRMTQNTCLVLLYLFARTKKTNWTYVLPREGQAKGMP